LVSGLAFAVVMGVVGGFFPALRAARLQVVQALR
jgi:ABC-type antimicrobial peptide transport system permease subunit